MLDALAAVVATVIYYSVAVFKTERLCDLRDFGENICDYISIAFVKLVCTANVLLGNNQNMHGSLGLQIMKSNDFVVLICLIRRDRAVDYFTKNTVSQNG